VVKFFLHVSKKEQRKRFLDRLDDPDKRWKFNPGDIAERKLWSKYMAAYQDMIRHTSIPEAPWYVVPADGLWCGRSRNCARSFPGCPALCCRKCSGRAGRCWPSEARFPPRQGLRPGWVIR
jgi:hypothetical protein